MKKLYQYILIHYHLEQLMLMLDLMKDKGMDDVLLTGGGIIPDADVEALNGIGVAKLFPPGTSMGEIASYIENRASENRN